MELKSVGIVGIGSCVPKRRIKTADLIKKHGPFYGKNGRIITPSDVFELTGVKERRYIEDDKELSDLAFEATLKALENSKTSVEEIGAIYLSTSSPEMNFPATACILQGKLSKYFGKKLTCPADDILAACTGFIYALKRAYAETMVGFHKKILVGGVEVLSRELSWQSDEIQDDWKISLLFGDGAGVVIIGEVEESYGFRDFATGCDGINCELARSGGFGTRIEEIKREPRMFIDKNGHAMFKPAVLGMVEPVKTILERNSLKPEDVDLYVPHQANFRITMEVAERIGISQDKIYSNIDRFGNISSASIPLALDEAVREGKIKKGDLVMLTAAGSGVTYGACLLRWWLG